jgi:chromosome partition protein MukB
MRARATALVLVNWRGVFFERYLLDRHVTALEGANGAGKTTVMIAAYVVLLPDLVRLKFTNLGETGATGGDRGIYGRLGEPGPSYAALEIELPQGERLVAAVYLERKAAPSLELTPFVISKLPAETGAHQIFLRQSESHEHVATMADIEQGSAELGATLEVFGSAKDYFHHLFERGVSPLRLGLDEERNKFNDMLRTSMTGGISRTLTSDLRSFLFRQQTGLFDTLTRMRKNLDACRRTRVEVSEARVLEHEINGIYTAGHDMFAAALDACRQQAAERRLATERARQRLELERGQIDELSTRVLEAESLKHGLAPRIERAQQAEAAARERLVRATRALATLERVAQIEAERARLLPNMDAARAAQAEAAAAREQGKSRRDAAQQTLLRAAAGLASLQAGLEELHREAHAHRQLRAQLEAARAGLDACVASALALGLPGPAEAAWLAQFSRVLEATLSPGAPDATGEALTPELLADASRRVKQALSELDRARAERARRIELGERRRREHAEARSALALLRGEPVERDLGQHARSELGRLNELELLGTRQSELAEEWQRLAQLAERQRAVRAELSALGLEPSASAHDFMRVLAELDAALLGAGDAQRQHEAAAEQLADREQAAREARSQLERRVESFARLGTVAARLGEAGAALPATRAELGAALRTSHEATSALSTRAHELSQQARSALELARQLEALGGGVPSEVARLAEALEGQPLAARYEELELDDARMVQAELGPLASAIVVDDLERALAALALEPHDQRDVWLLQAGAEWPAVPHGAGRSRLLSVAAAPTNGRAEHDARTDAAAPAQTALAIDIGNGVRVSRVPVDVSLGRAARRRRAERARAEAEVVGKALASLEARRRQQEATSRDLELLLEHWDIWALGDPSEELARRMAELDTLAGQRQEQLRQSREARVAAAGIAARREALRGALGDHHLLDPPDYAAAAARARQQLERARSAALELERSKEARRTLIALVHELDAGAPDAAELLAEQRAQPELEAQRDRLFAVADALLALSERRAALGWTHAERALRERTELVPELEAQHERALGELSAAQLALERSESAWEQATAASQTASAQLGAVEAHLSRAHAELGAEGISDPSPEARDAAQLDVDQHAASLERLAGEQRGIEAALALARERLAEAEKRCRAADSEAEHERRASAPSEAMWRSLEAAARDAGVLELDAAIIPGPLESSSAQRWLEAESRRALLIDRLAAARGGAELAQALEAAREDAPGARDGRRTLAAWLDVRAWLSRRLPAQIAELGQPLLGLARLRDDLSELLTRLERQEGELRGTSADVARSIDVQLRRAGAQVKRLNRALEGVRFGSISGIRVQLDRIEKMEQVLRALREGETQELLFQSNLPIEEALDEIFRRHAGGRTGGQRLIDYREYLELSVQIQRRAAQAWERVNPSQVSTGEAIGIGAALMMVILSEWERDDQLLRQKRSFGSLRFLFLDEANRLSQDNLGVLFDLCEVLDLQLLIAAPEVARAQGNTTYRLVRRVSDEGVEEVLVTGRRATLPGVDASRSEPGSGDADAAPDEATAVGSDEATPPPPGDEGGRDGAHVDRTAEEVVREPEQLGLL